MFFIKLSQYNNLIWFNKFINIFLKYHHNYFFFQSYSLALYFFLFFLSEFSFSSRIFFLLFFMLKRKEIRVCSYCGSARSLTPYKIPLEWKKKKKVRRSWKQNRQTAISKASRLFSFYLAVLLNYCSGSESTKKIP